MDENVKTKSIKRLIFLVALTAIMFIMSTYAWFSTQKNVTLGGLEGKVNVAEGLQISLDALNWKNEIDLSSVGIEEYFASTNAMLGLTGENKYDLSNPYAGRNNAIPSELLPVSTTAQQDEGIGLQRLNMYRGENTDGIVLSDIQLLPEDGTKQDKNENGSNSGYYAIDFFLQNTSAETATVNDLLKLDSNSEISLLSTNKYSTGLQNTIRVAFALFNNDGTSNIKVNETPSQSQILEGTNNQNIIDVAIWEPNANGGDETTGYPAHVDYIVQNNNNVTWSVADAKTYFNQTITEPKVIRFDGETRIPTYALTSKSKDATYVVGSGESAKTVNGIKNIYDWASDLDTRGLAKQNTLTTTTEGVTELKQLVSVKDGTTNFSIAPGEYHKLRMYIWLEGQDVDCTNYASLGGAIHIDVGITKGDKNVEKEETPEGLYLPTGFSKVTGTSLDTGYVIQDSTGNQYVWVEVPKTVEVYPTAGLEVTNFTSEEYKKIENDLHTYTSVYRGGTTFTDTWYSEDHQGLTQMQYNELKQKMLKSVYQNGGFYVGRYEMGIDYSEGPRTTSGNITQTPVIKQNAYPYNFITCKQSQQLASSMVSGEYTTSLMFGVQWNLVLKYLETKGATQAELNSDSTNWGNYLNNQWTVNSRLAKYSTDGGITYLLAPYQKNEDGAILLTTGADTVFSKQNIFDLAGNVWEWTLESNSSTPCAIRGGNSYDKGGSSPVSSRGYGSTINSFYYVGFRVALY